MNLTQIKGCTDRLALGLLFKLQLVGLGNWQKQASFLLRQSFAKCYKTRSLNPIIQIIVSKNKKVFLLRSEVKLIW